MLRGPSRAGEVLGASVLLTLSVGLLWPLWDRTPGEGTDALTVAHLPASAVGLGVLTSCGALNRWGGVPAMTTLAALALAAVTGGWTAWTGAGSDRAPRGTDFGLAALVSTGAAVCGTMVATAAVRWRGPRPPHVLVPVAPAPALAAAVAAGTLAAVPHAAATIRVPALLGS
ncbi:hypothetical protein ACMATS_02750 [Streptoverticillium reticulum]|uniref:hypothetical protein n=1 Tax=Streptoverticillium reticulum TaxID=1433415 RepID=UPI0039BF739F